MELKTITWICKYYEQNVPNYQKYSLKVFHFYILCLRINTTTALMCILHVFAVDVYGWTNFNYFILLASFIHSRAPHYEVKECI